MNTEDLFYKPHIEPTRNYHSDGVILHEQPSNIQNVITEEAKTPIEQAYQRNVETIDRLLQIRKVTPLLPPKIVDTINTILDITIVGAWLDNEGPIQEIIKQDEKSSRPTTKDSSITNKTETESEEKEEARTIYQVPASGPVDENGDYEWPEMTSSGFDIEVEENKDIWDMAQDQYMIDASLIREAFSIEYNNVLEGYIYQLLTAMDESGLNSPEMLNNEYEGETVTGISENDQHLNDLIVRNQGILSEMGDLFQQTHDLYTTNTIIGSFDTVAQERIRYLKERYIEAAAKNYLEMYDKTLLASVRNIFEDRYIIARSEAYKYLHSTVTISEQMLKLALASNMAKCSLLKKGIDIFAKKEYQNEAFSNSTEGTGKSRNTKDPSNKATDTVNTDTDKADISSINTELNNTIKDVQQKTRNAASGTVKTVMSQAKISVNAAAKNTEQKQKQEGERKPQ